MWQESNNNGIKKCICDGMGYKGRKDKIRYLNHNGTLILDVAWVHWGANSAHTFLITKKHKNLEKSQNLRVPVSFFHGKIVVWKKCSLTPSLDPFWDVFVRFPAPLGLKMNEYLMHTNLFLFSWRKSGGPYWSTSRIRDNNGNRKDSESLS